MHQQASVRHRVAAIGAAADGDAVGVGLALQNLAGRGQARDRALDRQLWHIDAERAEQQVAPVTGGPNERLRANNAVLEHHAAHPAAAAFDSAPVAMRKNLTVPPARSST